MYQDRDAYGVSPGAQVTGSAVAIPQVAVPQVAVPSYQLDIPQQALTRLEHLRREAENQQLSVTSFIRRACKVFFSLEEVSRGGIGLLDEKKLDMILCESRRYYPDKATESLVRRTISTYVCQTRGQMRAQESHMQSHLHPRERYGLIQNHPQLAIQQFSPGVGTPLEFRRSSLPLSSQSLPTPRDFAHPSVLNKPFFTGSDP